MDDVKVKDEGASASQVLGAEAFAQEINNAITLVRNALQEAKVPSPIGCAAMLVICHGTVTEGHPMKHALATVLRKNYPFLKMESTASLRSVQ